MVAGVQHNHRCTLVMGQCRQAVPQPFHAMHTPHHARRVVAMVRHTELATRLDAHPQATGTSHVPAHWEQLLATMPPGKRRLLQRYIQQLRLINALEQPMAALSDEELASHTVDFRARLAAGTPLDSLLVEAFAVVREASKRVLGMRPYDVQLVCGCCGSAKDICKDTEACSNAGIMCTTQVGAMALHEGKVAEMQTGEGKTLVAAIAAYLNALPGKGVHIITVNDYLATRDAGWCVGVFVACISCRRCDVHHTTGWARCCAFWVCRWEPSPAPTKSNRSVNAWLTATSSSRT